MMKILFLACLGPKTGNCTTAERIRSHIEAAGHTCVLRDTADFPSPRDVADVMTQDPSLRGALAIHLYKGGRLLLDIQVPFGIVFGGTDVNEDVKDERKRAVMECVLRKARFAVAFTDKMKEEAELFMFSQSSKIHVQPQGFETRVAPCFCWRDFLQSSGIKSENVDDLRVFLLVCGLRRVKDPLYVVRAFSEWHAENPRVALIIIGPKIDPVFTEEVKASVQRSGGIFLTPEREQDELHAAMRNSFALVNSSVSEGMSAAVLEAMDLGVPVLARNIPGNAAIVQHERTGFLFSSPEEFICLAKRLLGAPELMERVVTNAKRYVDEHHSSTRERTTYQQLLKSLE
ncbi:glycosyltransferase 1 domain-containing protein 1 isoform X2 [Denticeps clupeoides]|uniref:Glycosyl transferase family 1 domain-containing protein n=1 Tax=Denticeps clupeoides TaxID=299321 RepID=A0AAY4CWC7_9TELE|nr:glycosyltransferase 1 domain-containing protein 1 isoform X2 [Denticeps clupeoides]